MGNGAGVNATTSARTVKPKPSMPKRRFPWTALVLILAAGSGAAAWYYFFGFKSAPVAAAPPPPVQVGVQTVAPKSLRLWGDFSGRLRAVDSAEIRPEVSGRITEVRFLDGQSVKQGDVIVVIDPTPFAAAVARAQARIATAKAALEFSTSDQARDATLLPMHAIAQRELDQANSSKDAAAAELLAAQAELQTAQVDLNHAYVKAPISGRLSRAELTVGNIVQSGPNAPILTSIVSEEGIYADFEVDEQTYLDTIHDNADGNAEEKTIPVELILPGHSDRVFHGFIQNFDNRIDTASGTIRARAKFDNSDRALVAGMFVTVRLSGSSKQNLILIPDRAIGFDQSKRFVYVVSSDDKVTYREVDLGDDLGGRSIVLKGLDPGDKVIVDGLQRVRTNDTVQTQEVPEVAQDGDGDVETAQASAAKDDPR